jgi:membrane dipeptidase
MAEKSWYDDAIIIDGLNASHSGPHVWDLMRQGGLTAVHITHCSPYLRLPDTMKSMALWKKYFRDNADKAFQVYTVADIHRAKAENRLGIILGWQDSTGFDDHLYNIDVFKELGVRFVQLTYNTANGVGFGCYDSFDAGLTDFGREVVVEMNRAGIAVDLSHCSSKTASDAIEVCTKPVCYTHIAPTAFCDVPRNKSDRDIKLMADHGGYVGLSLHPFLLKKSNDSELDDYIDIIEYVLNIAGEDQVGIGTDFFEGHGAAQFGQTMTRRDKYHARVIGPPIPNTLRYPSEMPSIANFRNIVPALERRGWKEGRMRKLLGDNYLASSHRSRGRWSAAPCRRVR